MRTYAKICGFAFFSKKNKQTGRKNKRGDRCRSRSFVTGLVVPTPGSTLGFSHLGRRSSAVREGERLCLCQGGRYSRPRSRSVSPAASLAEAAPAAAGSRFAVTGVVRDASFTSGPGASSSSGAGSNGPGGAFGVFNLRGGQWGPHIRAPAPARQWNNASAYGLCGLREERSWTCFEKIL